MHRIASCDSIRDEDSLMILIFLAKIGPDLAGRWFNALPTPPEIMLSVLSIC